MLGSNDPYFQEKTSFTEGMVDHGQHRLVEIAGSKSLQVGNTVQGSELDSYKQVLVNYQDVFAWNYTKLKGVPPGICER